MDQRLNELWALAYTEVLKYLENWEMVMVLTGPKRRRKPDDDNEKKRNVKQKTEDKSETAANAETTTAAGLPITKQESEKTDEKVFPAFAFDPGNVNPFNWSSDETVPQTQNISS